MSIWPDDEDQRIGDIMSESAKEREQRLHARDFAERQRGNSGGTNGNECWTKTTLCLIILGLGCWKGVVR